MAPHIVLKQKIQEAISEYEKATGMEVYTVNVFYNGEQDEMDIEIDEDDREMFCATDFPE